MYHVSEYDVADQGLGRKNLSAPDRQTHVPLPSQDRINRLSAFQEARDWIEQWALHRKRHPGPPPEEGRWLGTTATPLESWLGLLKRNAYQLIVHYVQHGRVTMFERIIRHDGRNLSSRIRLADNPFHYGMLALFPTVDVIHAQDRGLFAYQMLHAYRHRVSPQLLVGFIYQSGNHALIKKKLDRDYIESGFENQFDLNIWNNSMHPPRMLGFSRSADEDRPDDDVDLGSDDDIGVHAS